jgi:hypothetical protein
MENYLTRCNFILLHLYPHQFRSGFGEEMQAIFEAVTLRKIGHEAKPALFFQEPLDLPSSLFEAMQPTGCKEEICLSTKILSHLSQEGRLSLGYCPSWLLGLSA